MDEKQDARALAIMLMIAMQKYSRIKTMEKRLQAEQVALDLRVQEFYGGLTVNDGI